MDSDRLGQTPVFAVGSVNVISSASRVIVVSIDAVKSVYFASTLLQQSSQTHNTDISSYHR
jgi:hypothetical protein